MYIILFDGVCNFCNAAINFVIDRDTKKRFVFASLQSDTGKHLMKEHRIDTNSLESVILIKPTKVYQKSGAVLEISRHLNGLWPALYIFKLVPAPIRNFLYDQFARKRYQLFGKADSCRMPTPDLKARFLV